jgi:hypothetical protein
MWQDCRLGIALARCIRLELILTSYKACPPAIIRHVVVQVVEIDLLPSREMGVVRPASPHPSLSSPSLSSALRIRSFASLSSFICCSVFEVRLRRLLVLVTIGAACFARFLVGFTAESDSDV